MSKSSPTTARTVSLLNFLAQHSQESFTLSELARRLSWNKATTHAMLGVLLEAGYLLKHADRSFSLGPGAAAIGVAAASAQLRLVEYAHDVMLDVSRRFSVQVVALAGLGPEMVVLATVGTGNVLTQPLRLGQRLPLAPPFGAAVIAWSSPERVQAWLARAPSSDPAAGDRYLAALEHVRQAGTIITQDMDTRVTLRQALDRLSDEQLKADGLREVVSGLIEDLTVGQYYLLEPDPELDYPVRGVASPVFGPAGDAVFYLSTFGYPARVSGAVALEHADVMRAASGQVSDLIRGRAARGEGAVRESAGVAGH